MLSLSVSNIESHDNNKKCRNYHLNLHKRDKSNKKKTTRSAKSQLKRETNKKRQEIMEEK